MLTVLYFNTFWVCWGTLPPPNKKNEERLVLIWWLTDDYCLYCLRCPPTWSRLGGSFLCRVCRGYSAFLSVSLLQPLLLTTIYLIFITTSLSGDSVTGRAPIRFIMPSFYTFIWVVLQFCFVSVAMTLYNNISLSLKIPCVCCDTPVEAFPDLLAFWLSACVCLIRPIFDI